jgi:F0F1-type ATP synthase membrane subunit b/b'
MNNQQLEKKVRQDASKVKKDFNILLNDTSLRLSKFENHANQVTGQAKENLTTKVEDSIAQLRKDFEKLIDDTQETVAGAASTMKKDIGHQLNLVNAKAQKITHKKSDDTARKATIYSLVAVTLTLVVSFVLIILLKPTRQPVG